MSQAPDVDLRISIRPASAVMHDDAHVAERERVDQLEEKHADGGGGRNLGEAEGGDWGDQRLVQPQQQQEQDQRHIRRPSYRDDYDSAALI